MNYIGENYFGLERTNIVFDLCFFLAGGLIYLYKDDIEKLKWFLTMPGMIIVIFIYYFCGAMIRLAYFNVMEEIRQKEEGGVRKQYEGLPVTSAALIFPLIMLLQFLTPKDLTAMYFAGLVVVGFLFISKITVKKPDSKGLWRLIVIGAIEFMMLIGYLVYKKLIGA